ncbi:MAG: glycosyltransferase [Flavobacterium sp.]|nr:MAG: glycosyltransferase [Flavobacterium sp.]
MFGINNVVVAHPEIIFENPEGKANLNPDKIHFFYPSYPRMFKNFEYIVDAFALLPEHIQSLIEIHLTLNNENRYANYIVEISKKYPAIKCIGLLKRETVLQYYNTIDVLLFPSRLETWGLPLSEFKQFEKDIFAINLPYAKETIGGYERVYYFEPKNPETLVQLITSYVENKLEKKALSIPTKAPDFKNWNSLFDFIFKEN